MKKNVICQTQFLSNLTGEAPTSATTIFHDIDFDPTVEVIPPDYEPPSKAPITIFNP
jgi:hypothetical protein